MMKYLSYTVLFSSLLLLFGFPSKGQTGSDSLKVDILSLPFQTAWKEISAQPFRPYLIQQQFGRSYVGFSNETGEFRNNQQQERSKNLQLFSEGLRALRGYWLEGGFSYQKVENDSLGWLLTREASSNPYNWGNIKKGNWSNDQLDIHVNVVRPVMNEKLVLGLGLQYQLQQMARSNDPRPEIDFSELEAQLQVGYQIHPNHLLSASARLGFNTENGSYRFYNDNNDSYGATEYRVHTLFGLGSYDLIDYKRYRARTNTLGAGLQWHFNNKVWEVNNELAWKQASSTFKRLKTEEQVLIKDPVGDYTLSTTENRLYMRKLEGSWQQQWVSLTTIEKGKDWNYILGGVNYFYDAFEQKITYLISQPIKRISLEGQLAFRDQSKKDYNASHQYSFSNLLVGVKGEKAFEVQSITYRLRVGADYRHNLTQSIQVLASQENIVTQSVVYPEFQYNTASYIAPEAAVSAEKAFDRFRLQGRVTYQSTVPLNVISIPNSLFEPTGKRDLISFKLTFLH
ncbi:DUF6850 family outer membrane beta-barrel protein [Limibacter armeniacum]|uniref:DUF6850 family outer membrane beta-barrel protein n=1 Tax=Limibacter armeniacum TaxID=466084 RepID=UPI002FE687B3